MAYYDITFAAENFDSLIDKAVAGEDVVITRGGQPMVVIVPIVKDAAGDDRNRVGKPNRNQP